MVLCALWGEINGRFTALNFPAVLARTSSRDKLVER